MAPLDTRRNPVRSLQTALDASGITALFLRYSDPPARLQHHSPDFVALLAAT